MIFFRIRQKIHMSVSKNDLFIFMMSRARGNVKNFLKPLFLILEPANNLNSIPKNTASIVRELYSSKHSNLEGGMIRKCVPKIVWGLSDQFLKMLNIDTITLT